MCVRCWSCVHSISFYFFLSLYAFFWVNVFLCLHVRETSRASHLAFSLNAFFMLYFIYFSSTHCFEDFALLFHSFFLLLLPLFSCPFWLWFLYFLFALLPFTQATLRVGSYTHSSKFLLARILTFYFLKNTLWLKGKKQNTEQEDKCRIAVVAHTFFLFSMESLSACVTRRRKEKNDTHRHTSHSRCI